MSSKGIAFVTGAGTVSTTTGKVSFQFNLHRVSNQLKESDEVSRFRLAEDGFDVAVNDIPGNSAKLDTVVAEIKQKGRESSAHLADVSEDENVKSMIEEVVKKHGGLDVMVANAGVPGPYRVQLTEVSVEQWDQVMNVNARGCFLCYKYAGLQMIKQGRGGRIIGASSIAGKKGFPLQGPYSASKFAIRALPRPQLASELGAHGITVNAYSPGAVETAMLTGATTNPQHAAALINKFKEMSPLKLVGTPEDIANLVSFLASKESQFITGQSISINGGLFFD